MLAISAADVIPNLIFLAAEVNCSHRETSMGVIVVRYALHEEMHAGMESLCREHQGRNEALRRPNVLFCHYSSQNMLLKTRDFLNCSLPILFNTPLNSAQIAQCPPSLPRHRENADFRSLCFKSIFHDRDDERKERNGEENRSTSTVTDDSH